MRDSWLVRYLDLMGFCRILRYFNGISRSLMGFNGVFSWIYLDESGRTFVGNHPQMDLTMYIMLIMLIQPGFIL